MKKKYEFTGEVKGIHGHQLHRIRAVRSFGDVKEGDLGGWIVSESNLSHDGDCWVGDEAAVWGSAQVFGDAQVYGEARVCGNAIVGDEAWVSGYAWVGREARVKGEAQVYGEARVHGSAYISDNAHVYGYASVFGNASVRGSACIYSIASVYGNAYVYDRAHVYDEAKVYEDANVFSDARVSGDVHVKGCAMIRFDISNNNEYILIGPAGNDRRMLTIDIKARRVVAGCFFGSFDEFIDAVKHKYGDDYGSYATAIELMKSIRL